MANDKTIWEFLKSQGLNDYGAAGLMGNLYAESGLSPTNLQNTYNNKFGMTDDEYTADVDAGRYGNFVHDSAGYGLAQWTFWSRKQGLRLCKIHWKIYWGSHNAAGIFISRAKFWI